MRMRLKFVFSGLSKRFLLPRLAASFTLLSLSACSSIYGESFDCGAGTGVPCTSISDINSMVNRGEIGGVKGEKESSSSKEGDVPEPSSLPLFQSVPLSSSRGVVRRPEKTLRVWLAPHLEESGVYAGERYIYTVVSPGMWVEATKPVSQGKERP